MGLLPLAHSGLRTHHALPALRAIRADARHAGREWRDAAARAGVARGNLGQRMGAAENGRDAPLGDRRRVALKCAAAAQGFSRAVPRHDVGRRADRSLRRDDADDRRCLRARARQAGEAHVVVDSAGHHDRDRGNRRARGLRHFERGLQSHIGLADADALNYKSARKRGSTIHRILPRPSLKILAALLMALSGFARAQDLKLQPIPFTTYLDFSALSSSTAKQRSFPIWLEAFEIEPQKASDGKIEKTTFRLRFRQFAGLNDELMLRLYFDDTQQPVVTAWSEIGNRVFAPRQLGQGLGLPSSETLTIAM